MSILSDGALDPFAHDPILSEADAAALLGKKVQTLRKGAVRGQGPARIKVGRTVRYRQSSLHAWLAAQEQDPDARLAA